MSEPQPSQSHSGRIIALDGLRALAVALVIAGHGVDAYWPQQAGALWLAPFVNASLGVRLFFVLSGFLITSLLWREHQRTGAIDWRAFVLRRSLRIWPGLYAYIAVMLLLSQLGVLAISPGQFLAAATLTWNYAAIWLQDGTSQGGWFLGHLWTLALEQQFYLAWPLAIVLLGWRRAGRLAVVVPLLLPLVRVAWYFAFPGQRGLLGMMFHTAIDSILIGCAFALHQDRIHRWLAAHRWAFPTALLFVLLISPLIASVLRPYRITVGFGLDAVGCGLLILAAREPLTAGARRWASFLSRPWLVWLGTISYGLYLWQQPFLTTWNTTLSGRFPLSLLAILACALISFFWIEMPGLRVKQLFSRSTL
jgi:peptidoglycan/LPS O-acetylase OafA/YrhL